MMKRGYTLIEMIISIGLVALLLVVIVNSAIAISRSHDRSRKFLEINDAAMGAFSVLSREIRKASSLDEVNSVLNASDGKIRLDAKKEDGTHDWTSIYLAGSRVKEENSASLSGDLTPAGADVSNLTFRLFKIASTTAIRVEMTVAPLEDSSIAPMNFYGTYVLRGSYTQ